MKKLLCLILLVAPLVACATNKAELYNQGLDAIGQKNWSKLADIQQSLGKDYPLNVYLEYQQLQQDLPDAEPLQIQAFREQYSHTPLANRLLVKAIVAYANAERWDALLKVMDHHPNSTSLRCDYDMALLHTGKQKELRSEVAVLLKKNGSQPRDCRQLIGQLVDNKLLGNKDLLGLMHGAFLHRQSGWLSTINGWLPKDNLEAKWLKKLYHAPETLAELPTKINHRPQLVALALAKWTQEDAKAALAWWQQAPAADFASSKARQQLARRIAWYSAIKHEQPNRDWLNQWLETHHDRAILEQRTRHAIDELDWKGVLHWVSLMPASEANSSHWRYWSGRAKAELKQPKAAHNDFVEVAKHRNFYGFLAAKRLGQPFSLNNKSSKKSAKLQLSTPEKATLSRIPLLLAAKDYRNARSEWYYLLNHVDKASFEALGHYAITRHWYNFAIVTAIKAGEWNRMAWRFPLAWKATFDKAANEVGRDDGFLLMAIARRESSFYAGARSGAGARGLMQLMPTTAQHVASKLGKQVATADLYNPDINLELGAAYLDGLLKKYRGNEVLALTAYNAGPSRVAAWLDDTSKPVDIWIETIPFHETRNYVKAVLAYRVIFMRRAGIDDNKIDLLGKDARDFAYTHAALADEQANVN